MKKAIKLMLVLSLATVLALSLAALIACDTNSPRLEVAVSDDAAVFKDSSLESVKQYLTVTYIDSDGSKTVTDYELQGTLTVGQTTLTVKYSGLEVTVNVTVTDKPTVTVNLNGGTFGENLTVNSDGTITPPSATPTRAGYVFAGWYKDSALQTTWNFAQDKVTESITLYAKWTAVYTVTFDSNGGSAVTALTNIEKNSKITEPTAPTKDGFKFAGWYKDSALQTVWNFEQDKVASNTTLYAKWASVYTVTFNSNGGSAVTALANIEENSKITEPTAPTRDDCKFEGWYKDSALQTAWDFEQDRVTANTTLYAKWLRVCTVTFNSNGGSAVSTLTDIEENTAIAEPTAPTKNEHVFIGWYKDDAFQTKWNFEDEKVTTNVTLYARWTKIVAGTEGLEYTLSDDEKYYTLTGLGSVTDVTNIAVASVYQDKPVSEIGSGIFSERTGVVNITIPDSIDRIRSGAFNVCTALERVNYTGNLTGWCNIKFDNNSANPLYRANNLYVDNALVTEIVIPDNVAQIGSYAFYGCTSATSVTLGAGLKSIGYSAFEMCDSLSRVNYKGNIADWCAIQFADANANPMSKSHNLYINNQEVRALVIPDGVTGISQYAFCGMTNLESVTLSKTVATIDNSAFGNCTNLATFDMGNVIYVGTYAFENCTNLASVELSDKLTEIGRYAFLNCEKITSLTFPKHLRSIDENAFKDCVGLKNVTWNAVSCNPCTVSTSIGFETCSLETVTIGDGVTAVPSFLFKNCGLSNIIWGKDVKTIGGGAFQGCSITTLTIPDTVTTVSDYAFDGCPLTSITIGKNVTEIGYGAFADNHQLVSITIPKNVKSIDRCVFESCDALESIIVEQGNANYHSSGNCLIDTANKTVIAGCKASVIPTDAGEVTAIGAYAFRGLDTLREITIPSNVETVEDSAFLLCSYLENLTIQKGVKVIGDSAFSDCTLLRTVTVPESVKTIGENAFTNCISLQSLTIEEGVETIGDSAFSNCHYVQSVTLPNSVKTMGFVVFSGCESLTTLILSDNLESIDGVTTFCDNLQYNEYENALYLGSNGNPYFALIKAKNTDITECAVHENTKYICQNAFKGCASLATVTVPAGVKAGENVFQGCNVLQYTEYNNALYLGSVGNPYEILVKAKDTSITSCEIHADTKIIYNYAFQNCVSLASITIPAKVTSIGQRAFDSCSALTSITIPANVKTIGTCAFDNCQNITSLTISEGVVTIGTNAFQNCKKLEQVVIPDSVTAISAGMLRNCSGLTSVTIPGSVKEIGDRAFEGCYALTRVNFLGDIAAWCNYDFAYAANPLQYAHNLYINDNLVTELVIPATVTEIKDQAFYNCTSITSVTIPDNVKGVGNSAFYRCSNLTNVTLGSGIEWIGQYAFSDCDKLASIVIPDNIKNIGTNAFTDCSLLASVTIGNGLTEIDDYVFNRCDKLTSVTIPEGVTRIGEYAFEGCYALTSVTLPDSIISLDAHAFEFCQNLTSVTLPDGIKFIGAGAFYAGGLTSITVPGSVVTIDNSAFGYCRELISVTLKEGVEVIAEMAFEGCGKLASVTLPVSLEVIASDAFKDCETLSEIRFAGTESQWKEIAKAKNWKETIPATKVICSDGEVAL